MPTDAEILEMARLLRISGREVAKVRDRNAESLGMTSAQADVLTYVDENPGCTISDVRTRLEASHQAACTMVSRLESRGLVTVGASPRDGRAKVLTTTDEGRDIHRRFLEMGAEVNAGLLYGFSEEETQELRRMLMKLLDNIRRRRYALTP